MEDESITTNNTPNEDDFNMLTSFSQGQMGQALFKKGKATHDDNHLYTEVDKKLLDDLGLRQLKKGVRIVLDFIRDPFNYSSMSIRNNTAHWNNKKFMNMLSKKILKSLGKDTSSSKYFR